MNYQTYKPHSDLEALVKFYWTLEVPFDRNNQKQKIIPDGCIEMTFNLGDKIKRYTSETEFIFNPNAMVMGQRTKSYFIEPVGNVDTIAICFYPHGFSNFVNLPLENLVDQETPIQDVFNEIQANVLEENIIKSTSTKERIGIIETFLLNKLNEEATIENIVKTTVDTLLTTNGNISINVILKDNLSKRRQLERHFKKQIGISPKQLGKVIRLQATLQMLVSKKSETLTDIAYENEYFDQNHFIKDFKEFVGITPKEFLGNENMALSTLFYK
ncbi:helix-turn-helix domain-containing protein [Flavobacterium galactosidilyticum]|uniref:AraC family transcriptional regulator n=1 Tax=Flavobacterium galactosidilyticum TaxID=2893886 RepID=UPI001E368580|nr:helix-turn-helix domain-containing protein [Flavobacterium sp. F-340]UFH46628.1 helix-turn-helix domain-containing protein [Flavobacterium sp. F-340]